MGTKQTKIDGSYLPSTPDPQFRSQFINMNHDPDNDVDPRSPTGCRTPIHLESKRTDNVPLKSNNILHQNTDSENALGILRKRFLKSFACNISDPRSPSLNFNRTPLVFENTHQKSLSLDDTFADLFVESSSSKVALAEKVIYKCEQIDAIEMTEGKVVTECEETVAAPLTPITLQQQFDPRSPSINVERTPIVFTDEEDDANDIMLEKILDTLSLDLNKSEEGSMLSMTSQNINVHINNKNDMCVPPVNKHLDRVRSDKKSFSKTKYIESRRQLKHQKIYQDQENHMPLTPKYKLSQTDKIESLIGRRTPLSCVRNRNATHSRSRSVEPSAKSFKARLSLTSFDDTVNPTENRNLPSLRLKSFGSQDSLER